MSFAEMRGCDKTKLEELEMKFVSTMKISIYMKKKKNNTSRCKKKTRFFFEEIMHECGVQPNPDYDLLIFDSSEKTRK